jgi:hypothetical protein
MLCENFAPSLVTLVCNFQHSHQAQGSIWIWFQLQVSIGTSLICDWSDLMQQRSLFAEFAFQPFFKFVLLLHFLLSDYTQ